MAESGEREERGEGNGVGGERGNRQERDRGR